MRSCLHTNWFQIPVSMFELKHLFHISTGWHVSYFTNPQKIKYDYKKDCMFNYANLEEYLRKACEIYPMTKTILQRQWDKYSGQWGFHLAFKRTFKNTYIHKPLYRGNNLPISGIQGDSNRNAKIHAFVYVSMNCKKKTQYMHLNNFETNILFHGGALTNSDQMNIV